MGAGSEAIFVGLGVMVICGVYAALGLSFELAPDEEERKDFHWAWVKGWRWPGLLAKFVGLPMGAAIFLFGVGVSLADWLT